MEENGGGQGGQGAKNGKLGQRTLQGETPGDLAGQGRVKSGGWDEQKEGRLSTRLTLHNSHPLHNNYNCLLSLLSPVNKGNS